MKNNRSSKILEILVTRKKIEVRELATLLKVSQVTIRKDLDKLEEKGLIKRIHGYAEMIETDDINGRLIYHYDKKLKIARKASELVSDGDTVMIESGSCCAILASLLSSEKKELTIVTNSVYIAEKLRNSSASVILLGGIYQKNSQCLVGPIIAETVKNFNVNYFFVGTDGYSQKTGFTNKDQLRAQAVKDMAYACNEIVVLTESEKFKAAGTIPMNVADQPKIVITDSSIPFNIKSVLEENEISVILAEETD